MTRTTHNPLSTAQNVVIFLLRIYQALRPVLDSMQRSAFGSVPQCKHSPTCSEYAIERIRKYGTMRGIFLGAKRILNCR